MNPTGSAATMAQAQSIPTSSLQPDVEAPSLDSLAASLICLHSFADVAALVNSAQILPSQFVLPEADRPRLVHDAFLPQFDLPVLDLSLLAASQTKEERCQIIAWLSTIAKELGFFQIVNHGVEPELMKKMESFGRNFFEMPTNTKETVAGYRGKFDPSSSRIDRWLEALNLGSEPEAFQSSFLDVVWPDGNKEFRDCYEKYVDSMEKITQTICELLIESLGVNPSSVMHNFVKGVSGVRYNYYPPCPQPSLAVGLYAHTDPNALTVLFQDEVGGLQVRGKDGEWRAVKPKADAFVVNVGDTLKVLSNGEYVASEHRAVLNSSKARLSLGFFGQPRQDTLLKPLEFLVDGQHPPLFRPFIYGDYTNFRISTGKHNTLAAFVGIENPQSINVSSNSSNQTLAT